MTRNVTIGVPHRPDDPGARDFSLTETPIREDVPNREAGAYEKFVVDWGVRLTDRALVMHFYPPLNSEGKISDDWDASYEMDKRLDRAMPQVFDVSRITAGFEREFNSFFVIVGGGGQVLDVRLLVQRFLDAIQAPLR